MRAELNNIYDIVYWGISGFLTIFPCVFISLLAKKKQYFILRYGACILGIGLTIILLELQGYVYFNERWMPVLLQVFSVLVFFICNECSVMEIVYLKIWGIAFSGLLAQIPGLLATTALKQYLSGPFPIYYKLVSTAVIAIMIALFFMKGISRGVQVIGWREVIQSGAITLPVKIFNSSLFYRQMEESGGVYTNNIFLMQMFSSICVILALYMQLEICFRKQAQMDRDLRERIWALEKKHFEERQEQIDLINRKCHDLKHQIAALEQISDKKVYDRNIQELKEAVLMYDDTLHTGNLALETILMEKKLQYKERNVILNCIVDGISIEFIDTVDLYILLGNILDNALEGTLRIPGEENRIVEIRIFRDRNLIRMIFSNRFEGEIQFQDGLPISSKEQDGNHGFGFQSIRQIVEKYNGDMILETDDHYFKLKIMIPIPCEKGK